jgi:Nitrate and nitrite sensing
MPRAVRSKRVIVLVGVVVALLAGNWVRGNASGIRQAEQVTGALEIGASAARLAHELQRERDLSGFYVASGRRTHFGTMVAQRIWVNQANRSFANQTRRLEPRLGGYDPALGRGIGEVAARLAGLRLFRENSIDGLAAALGPSETLRWYDRTVEGLLGIVAQVSGLAKDGQLAKDLRAVVALTRYKEAVAQERSYLYAAYGCGGFADGVAGVPGAPARAEAGARAGAAGDGGPEGADQPGTATTAQPRDLTFRAFSAIVERRARARAEFERIAGPEWRDRLARELKANDDVASAEAIAAAVHKDPAAAARATQRDAKDWFLDMNSRVDTLRKVENQLFANVAGLANATRNGSDLW